MTSRDIFSEDMIDIPVENVRPLNDRCQSIHQYGPDTMTLFLFHFYVEWDCIIYNYIYTCMILYSIHQCVREKSSNLN